MIKGTVKSVGADAHQDAATKAWVYSVLVEPKQDHVEADGNQFELLPGMTGTVDVVTGDRKLISYFFEPIVKAIQDGLKER